MKKKIIYSVLLASLFLGGCTQTNTDNTASSIDTIEQSTQVQQATSHTLAFDESITFNDTDYRVIGYPVSGLKMTVKKPVIDENIVLGEGYPDSEKVKFEGKKALVVTTEVENTTDDYIDLVGHTILDSEGKTLDFTFVDGVSTQSINGLTGKQKATIVYVYLANDDKPVTVTYANATWKDDSKNSNKNAKKSSSTRKSTKVAKSSSSKSSETKEVTQSKLYSETQVTGNGESSASQSSPIATSSDSYTNTDIVDQHAAAGIRPEDTAVYPNEEYTPTYSDDKLPYDYYDDWEEKIKFRYIGQPPIESNNDAP